MKNTKSPRVGIVVPRLIKNQGWVSRLTSDNISVYFIQGKKQHQW